VRHRLGDVLVRVPAAAAEERRLEPRLPEPSPLTADTCRRAPGDSHVTASVLRARLLRAAPVGVVAERPELGGPPRPLEPARFVLSRLGVGRAYQSRDPEAARASGLQRFEAGPGAVVERPLDVAGNDGVAFL